VEIIPIYTVLYSASNLCNNSLEELSLLARENEITHMLVASLNAVFYKDSMKGNMELYSQLKNYHGETSFISFAIINPTYPGWKQDMTDAITKYGFKGIELCPLYHNYSLREYLGPSGYINPAAEAYKLAGEMGVPLRINAGFENRRQRHFMDHSNEPNKTELYEFLRSCSNTTTILNGFFPFLLGEDIKQLLQERSNVFFDITRIDAFLCETMERTLDFMNSSHLCFGTKAPFQYIETNLNKIFFMPESTRKKVLSENIKDYLF
jgi:hypothetical protein